MNQNLTERQERFPDRRRWPDPTIFSASLLCEHQGEADVIRYRYASCISTEFAQYISNLAPRRNIHSSCGGGGGGGGVSLVPRLIYVSIIASLYATILRETGNETNVKVG